MIKEGIVNLIRTSFFSGIATVIKIMIGLVLNKILAIYVGPAGVALLGQFTSYSAMITSFGNCGISVGVTKYIAEYCYDKNKQEEIVKNSLIIALYCSLVFGILNFAFSNNISIYLLNSIEYSMIFKLYAITLIFTSINTTLLSILNGYKEIKLFLSISILNNSIGLIMTYLLAVKYKVFGALLSVILTQSIVCISTLLIVRRFDWFDFSFLKARFDNKILIMLSKFSLMSISSATLGPLAQILVRKYLTEHLSVEATGYWQAVWQISSVYLMVITISLSTYFLPRFSEINDKTELRKEIIGGYKVVLPLTIAMAFIIYVLREYIIVSLFTPQFMPMKDLFLFQLTGDVLKISSWLLSYVMLAKAMTKWFVISEVIFNTSFVGLTYVFVNTFGLVGITYGYTVNYFCYFIFMRILIWKKFLCYDVSKMHPGNQTKK